MGVVTVAVDNLPGHHCGIGSHNPIHSLQFYLQWSKKWHCKLSKRKNIIKCSRTLSLKTSFVIPISPIFQLSWSIQVSTLTPFKDDHLKYLVAENYFLKVLRKNSIISAWLKMSISFQISSWYFSTTSTNSMEWHSIIYTVRSEKKNSPEIFYTYNAEWNGSWIPIIINFTGTSCPPAFISASKIRAFDRYFPKMSPSPSKYACTD
jgi:hypothetical protein